MATNVKQVESATDTISEAGTDRTSEGINVEIDTDAGPVSIVRTTLKSPIAMQHG
jgi:hypothetical protein